MAGERFGPYHLQELIGRGGMGEVYRAFDSTRRRVVALKRLPAGLLTDPQFRERFRIESEMAARLRSPHVIPIHDYGEIDGRLFIDMRLVEGEDLGERLTRGPLSPAAAVDVITAVAGALDAAHAQGLIHRDVKPSNVLLSAEEGVQGRDFVYLVDFGIARSLDGSGGTTGIGSVIGTADYMAPERFDQRPSDHRVDVYSLACLLHEALTGSKPFPTGSVVATSYSHMHAEPPRPSVVRPGVSPAFDAVIAHGMAKEPWLRFPSAGALAAAARQALTAQVDGVYGSVWPSAQGWFPPVTPPPSRRPLYAALGALGALAAVTVLTVTLVAATTGSHGTLRVAEILPVTAMGDVAIDPSGTHLYVGAPASGTDDSSDGSDAEGSEIQVLNMDGTPAAPAVRLPDPVVGEFALSADGARLFVLTQSADEDPVRHTLSVIDTEGGAITASVALPEGTGTYRVVASPDGDKAYVGALTSVEIVDVAAGGQVSVPLDAAATALAVSPDGSHLIVATTAGVRTIDPGSGAVTSTVEVAGAVTDIAIMADGSRAVAALSGEGVVLVLDLDGGVVTGTLPVGFGMADMVVTPDGRQALVSNADQESGRPDAATVGVLELTGGDMSTLQVGRAPGAIAISPDGSFGLVVTASSVVRVERDN